MSLTNAHLLIKNNGNQRIPKKLMLQKGTVVFNDNSPKLDFFVLKRLLEFISGARNKYKGFRLGFHINFSRVIAVDKLSVQLLECIIYSLIVDYGYHVTINVDVFKQIHTEGFQYTPLIYLESSQDYQAKFRKHFEYQTYPNLYRRVIPKEWSYDGQLGGIVFSDVAQTLKNFIENQSYISSLTEVITELINNANEHNGSACLLDIDVSDEYMKKDGSVGTFIGVNVAITSFSDQLLPTLLMQKFSSNTNLPERYKTIDVALENHRNYFNDDYSESDFFMIASFQDKISGRCSSSSGGTGLTRLLKSLEDYSDDSECYVVSGARALCFHKETLDITEDGWIGFNAEKDFVNYPPSSGVIGKSPIYIPGIAYNLCFVYKKEEL